MNARQPAPTQVRPPTWPAPDIEPPKVPADGLAELRLAKTYNRPVFLKQRPPIGQCPNCNGWASIWLQFTRGGPYQSPPLGLSTYINGWWSVEDKIYPCPVCGDRATLTRHLWKSSGLEEEEQDWRIDWLRGKPGKERGLEAAANILSQAPTPKGWYVITGGYGRGKSGILKALTASLITAGISARYQTAEGILAEIRSTYGSSQATEEDLRNKYGAYQFLAVDEVDRVSTTDWARSTLFGLLNTRYDRRFSGATAIATNLDPENLPEGMEYLASRMKAGQRILLGGGDLRDEIEF